MIRNNSIGGWIVQKFGGTSVGKLPLNIAEDIVRYVDENAHGRSRHFFLANLAFTARVWIAIALQWYVLLEVQERRLKAQRVGESQSALHAMQ